MTLTSTAPSATDTGFAGLQCSNCGADASVGPNFICGRCFGPLRAIYDYDRVRGRLTRETIAARDTSGRTSAPARRSFNLR